MSNCSYLLHWNVGAGAVDVWMRDRHPSFLPTNDKDDYNTAQANIHITTPLKHFDAMDLFSAT
jgi:hypothetical protein